MNSGNIGNEKKNRVGCVFFCSNPKGTFNWPIFCQSEKKTNQQLVQYFPPIVRGVHILLMDTVHNDNFIDDGM